VVEVRVHIGFLGAGKIAESHSFALDVLNYYYPDTPKIRKIVIASPTPASRESFAERFGFREAFPPEKIWEQAIDTLFILGPNQVHTPQLLQAVQQKHIKRIYVEKPIGTNPKDIQALEALKKSNHGKLIMMGFQYLQKSALRQALSHWQKADFGELIHFRAEYLHSSYLDPNYRQSHTHRFAPMPMDGAAVDLGSHPLSLLVAFIGPTLKVKSAAVSGNFNDVPDHTDLCTTILLEDVNSGAVGTLVASRVSSGAGDYLSLELRGANGSLLFNTLKPDSYDTYLPGEGWRKHRVLSDYSPTSEFPGKHAPSGWMRALIHNHYLFLGGEPGISFIPDLAHGIQVQQLLQQTADYAKK
jgi:predicted dehydrogenase